MPSLLSHHRRFALSETHSKDLISLVLFWPHKQTRLQYERASTCTCLFLSKSAQSYISQNSLLSRLSLIILQSAPQTCTEKVLWCWNLKFTIFLFPSEEFAPLNRLYQSYKWSLEFQGHKSLHTCMLQALLWLRAASNHFSLLVWTL